MSCENSCLGAWTVSVFYCLTFVSVKSTPSIDVRPSHFSTTLVYGSQNKTFVHLRCEVSNLEQNHKVSWFKNDRKITENEVVLEDQLTDERYNIYDHYNLLISSITSLHAYKDSGHYDCRVLNADNTVVTKSGVVVVAINVIPGTQYPICKQFIGERHFHGNVSEYLNGDNVTLQCLSDPGRPQVILQWFRNDETTPLSTWVENTEFNVYPIHYYTLDLSTEVTGNKFRCQLLQPARNCTIGPISIYDEPTINIYPEVTYVNSSDQAVTFTCIVQTGDPKVINYRWTVEKVGQNSLISDPQLFNISVDNTIKFSRVQSADSGEYNITCIVDYGFSSRDASARLIVKILSIPPATTAKTSMMIQQTHDFTISDHAERPEKTSYTVKAVETSLTTGQFEGDQQPTNKGQTGTIVGSIVGLLIFILLAVSFFIVFAFKLRKNKHKDGQDDLQGIAAGGGAANLALERREETDADYANTNFSQIANTSSDNEQEGIGEDGYAKLQSRGGEKITEPEYAHLNHVIDENPGINRDLVGDDGYANLEKGQFADNTEPVYAHLSNVSVSKLNP